jgi:alpha-glucosidase
MSDFLWWRDGVIYQIYPRSFSDSNGDGIGDLPGMISRLDYLAELGIDAIWLSPIYPTPDKDFGYDVSDYVNIDPRFGIMADYDRLVVEAHKRGIRVVLDLVLNHTSDQHPWFQESKSSRDNPKADWYIWKDRIPNNWLSMFGGPAWTYVPERKQYYYHMFLPEQPDVNWRNPEVRGAILNSVRFWLDRGTDGFRLDVFNVYFSGLTAARMVSGSMYSMYILRMIYSAITPPK